MVCFVTTRHVFFCSAECYNGATIPIPQLAKKTFTVSILQIKLMIILLNSDPKSNV